MASGMYCDEGEGTRGAYVLFFKPNGMPLFTITVRFNQDIGTLSVSEIAARAESIIRDQIAKELGGS